MLRQCIEVVGLRRGGEIVVISQFEWYRECRFCIYTRLKAIVALRRVLFFQKQFDPTGMEEIKNGCKQISCRILPR